MIIIKLKYEVGLLKGTDELFNHRACHISVVSLLETRSPSSCLNVCHGKEWDYDQGLQIHCVPLVFVLGTEVMFKHKIWI